MPGAAGSDEEPPRRPPRPPLLLARMYSVYEGKPASAATLSTSAWSMAMCGEMR